MASLNKMLSTPATSRLSLSPPRLHGIAPEVRPVQLQEVERNVRGFTCAVLGQERLEFAPPVGAKHDGLAVNQGLASAQAVQRLTPTPCFAGCE